MGGWIKLHRSLLESDLIQDDKSFRMFVWMLLSVVPVVSKQFVRDRVVELQPGQMIFTREMATRSLALSERAVRTALSRLISTSRVTSKTTNRFTLVTICNWARYQSVLSESDQHKDQQTDQQVTSRRPAESVVTKEYIYNKNTKSSSSLKKERIKEITPSRTCVRGNFYSTDSELVIDIYKAAYEYLNATLDKRFPYTDTLVRSWIHRWTKESDPCYSLDDLKQAVDNCRAAWLGDGNMCNNLRPSVIWGHKFPEYLNMVIKPIKQKGQHYEFDKHTPSTSTDPEEWLRDDREEEFGGNEAFAL